MKDLRNMFDITIRSCWEDVPFDMDDMEQMRQAEWYQEAVEDSVYNDVFNEGLLEIIASAKTELRSYEKAFVVYKLHFGTLSEQEGAVNAIACVGIKGFEGFYEDVVIKNNYVQNELNDLIEKKEE